MGVCRSGLVSAGQDEPAPKRIEMVKCTQCGQENEDTAPRCACGSELPRANGATSATPTTEVRSERGLRLKKVVFALWALAFVPLFPFARLVLNGSHIQRSSIGAAVFCASGIVALWAFGRDRRSVLFAWRVAFLAWATLFLPPLLTAVEGIATEGWPRGKHNQVVADLLILVFVLTIPAFVTSLCALLKTYRVTGGVALLTGLAYLVNGVLLIRATAPSKGWWFDLGSALNIVLTGAKMGSYLSIPIGVVFILGAVMVFRAARSEPLAASPR